MTTKFFSLTLTILLLLSQPTFLLGQAVNQQQDWSAVQALSPGIKLLVETKNGKRLKGTLNNASVATLALTRNNRTENLNKDDIQRVYRLNTGSREKSALIGTAAGAGLGAGAAAIALGSTGGSDDAAGILGAGILIGAGIGAVIGLVAGNGSRRVLIYESK
ncbi:MAG: hypothetical protein M3209_13560 [Acidobacteriota bacterium]|nr:hypothetical protein [Acidobacteriota bacterium]